MWSLKVKFFFSQGQGQSEDRWPTFHSLSQAVNATRPKVSRLGILFLVERVILLSNLTFEILSLLWLFKTEVYYLHHIGRQSGAIS